MRFMNKVWVWIPISLVFSICLSACAGISLLDVFVFEHESTEGIIVESVDFGSSSEDISLESQLKETEKSTSKNNSLSSSSNNSSNNSSYSDADNDEYGNSSNSSTENSTDSASTDSSIVPDAEIAEIAKYISVTKQIGSYSNENVSLTVTEKVFTAGNDKTTYFVVDLKVSSVKYLKTALASGNKLTTNKTETVANLATAQSAILAINGDGCGQSKRTTGYVVRNGVTYRSAARSSSGDTESLVIYGDGSMDIIDERKTSLDSVNNKWQVFSFGPALIDDGTISVTERQEISGQSMADNPRTAIGMVEPLHYVIIVGNGRTNSSKGLTLYQLAQTLVYEGCRVGYNLDGGGSSTLWFKGEVINFPTTNGRYSEREVSDIVYIGA